MEGSTAKFLSSVPLVSDSIFRGRIQSCVPNQLAHRGLVTEIAVLRGISARTLQQWLGHSDVETTIAYLKGSDAASERSQAKVAKAYEAFA